MAANPAKAKAQKKPAAKAGFLYLKATDPRPARSTHVETWYVFSFSLRDVGFERHISMRSQKWQCLYIIHQTVTRTNHNITLYGLRVACAREAVSSSPTGSSSSSSSESTVKAFGQRVQTQRPPAHTPCTRFSPARPRSEHERADVVFSSVERTVKQVEHEQEDTGQRDHGIFIRGRRCAPDHSKPTSSDC